MSDVKLVKKWVAADGSEHDTKRAAEENAQRLSVVEIMERSGSVTNTIDELLGAGLLSLKVKQAHKPRVVKPKVAEPAVAAVPVQAKAAKK